MNWNHIYRNAQKVLVDNAPIILTSMSVAGVVATAIFTTKATIAAEQLLLKKAHDEQANIFFKHDLHDRIKYTWKLYIPAACTAAASIGCIIGAQSVNARRNAALMSLYTITDKALIEYRDKVQELMGPKKAQEVHDEIQADHIRQNPVSSNEVAIVGKGEALCYDSISGRYFKSDIESIRKAVNDLNVQIINEVYASQNDFYRLIGLGPVAMGEEVGWRTDRLLEVGYSSHLADDGTPCLSLDYKVEPIRGYWKGF